MDGMFGVALMRWIPPSACPAMFSGPESEDCDRGSAMPEPEPEPTESDQCFGTATGLYNELKTKNEKQEKYKSPKKKTVEQRRSTDEG